MKPPPRGPARPTPGLSKGALKVRRPKVTDLFENEAVFLCTHDLAGKILSINDASCRALGYPKAELVGASIRDVLAPEYRNQFDGYLGRLRGSGAASGVMTIAARNGEKRFWHYQNVVKAGRASDPVVHGTAIDVTELIEANRSAYRELEQQAEALRRAKEYSDTLIRTANVMILGLDPEGRIEIFNEAAEKMTGYSEAEIRGRSWFDTVVPRKRFPETWNAFQEARAAGEALPLIFENPVLTKSGEQRLVSWQNRSLFRDGMPEGSISFGMDITDQRSAEEALRQSEERYRLLFERNLAGMYRSMRDGTLLDCNEAFANILGFSSREEILQQNARSLYFYESDRKAVLDEVAASGSVSARETCLRRRDGTAAWVVDSITFVPPGGDNPAMLEGSIVDISDRRNAEEAVRVSEERYRFLFERNPLPMWVYEIETLKFVDVNDAAIAHYGYSRAEFLSMRLPDIWPPEDRGRHPIAPSADKPQPFSPSRHVQKNGSIADVEVAVVDLPGGQVRRRMALARDVTEKKAAERALVESEKQFRHIFDFAPVGIYQTTADGKVLTVNPAFAQMLGYTADELVRLSAYDLYLHPEERDAAIRAFNESSTPGMTIERALKSKTGDPVWVQITAQAVRDEENRSNTSRDSRSTSRTKDGSTSSRRACRKPFSRRRGSGGTRSTRSTRQSLSSTDTPSSNGSTGPPSSSRARRTWKSSGARSTRLRTDRSGRRLPGLVRDPESERSRSGVMCHDEDAGKIWEISVSGYQSPDSKEPPMSIVILRDVTATVKLQESVLRAESMSSMGSLVAGVAHEVRNPLFAISATLDAFDARFRERDDYKKYAQALRTQVDRMSHLMRDLPRLRKARGPGIPRGRARRPARSRCRPRLFRPRLPQRRPCGSRCSGRPAGLPRGPGPDRRGLRRPRRKRDPAFARQASGLDPGGAARARRHAGRSIHRRRPRARPSGLRHSEALRPVFHEASGRNGPRPRDRSTHGRRAVEVRLARRTGRTAARASPSGFPASRRQGPRAKRKA